MSNSVFAVLALGLMLGGAAPDKQDAPKPDTPVEAPSVTLPPELDRVLRDYERAWRAGDAAALASLFAEDGFLLPGNRPPIRGRAAIRANYEKQAGEALRLRALSFASQDTIGYIIGAYGYDNKPGDAGKFTLTLRRAPGEPWLIFSDMDNSSIPPKRASPPGTPSPAVPPAAQ